MLRSYAPAPTCTGCCYSSHFSDGQEMLLLQQLLQLLQLLTDRRTKNTVNAATDAVGKKELQHCYGGDELTSSQKCETALIACAPNGW